MNYREFSRNAAAARSQSGKGIATLLLEAAALRFASGRLGISEYFFYRLYENSFTPAQRRQFIGWRYSNAIDAKLNDEEWRQIAAHPWLGVLALFQVRGAQELPYRSMVVAHEHHMKHDLTGYPRPIRQRQLSVFSKIVAIADGFDAATSRRSTST